VVDYLLELRGDMASKGALAIPIESAWVVEIQVPGKSGPEPESMVMVKGPPLALLELVSRDHILSRAADQLIPFFENTLGALTELQEHLDKEGVPKLLRVIACPGKSLTSTVVAAVPQERLSPAEFDGVLSVLQWERGEDEETGLEKESYLWSLLPRTQWDPRAWRARQ